MGGQTPRKEDPWKEKPLSALENRGEILLASNFPLSADKLTNTSRLFTNLACAKPSPLNTASIVTGCQTYGWNENGIGCSPDNFSHLHVKNGLGMRLVT